MFAVLTAGSDDARPEIRARLDRAELLARPTRAWGATRMAVWNGRRQVDRTLGPVLVFGFIIGVGQAIGRVHLPLDAAQYWQTDLSALYTPQWTIYPYPPPLAQLVDAVHSLPFQLVVVPWTTMLFGCLWYCARWLTWPLVVVGFAAAAGILPSPFGVVLGSVLLGNVTMLLAACVVAGVTRPDLLGVPVLTKIGPAIGYLWPLARGEWRALGRALAILALVVGISVALGPNLWADWFAFVGRNWNAPTPVPVVDTPWSARFAAACVLVLVAARTDRAWIVPIAAGLAVPALYGWWAMLPYAVGAVALGRPRLGVSFAIASASVEKLTRSMSARRAIGPATR